VDSRVLLHNTTVDRFERTRGFKDIQAGLIRLGSIAHGGLHETFQQLSVESNVPGSACIAFSVSNSDGALWLGAGHSKRSHPERSIEQRLGAGHPSICGLSLSNPCNKSGAF